MRKATYIYYYWNGKNGKSKSWVSIWRIKKNMPIEIGWRVPVRTNNYLEVIKTTLGFREGVTVKDFQSRINLYKIT